MPSVPPLATISLTSVPNTLGLPASAAHAVRLTDAAQLPALSGLLSQQQDLFVLGGGSNVILPPQIQSLIVLPHLRGIRLLEATDDAWIVEAQAGEPWHDFVAHTLSQGWFGLENLALIPGTVGAGPVQNIGAYGVELDQRLHSVLAWHLAEERLHELSVQDCRFSYRDSLFKQSSAGAWLIVAVRFHLPRAWQPVLDYPDLRRHALLEASAAPSARQIFDAVCDIRRAKLPDPAKLGNAGSFFKNPIVPAAQADSLRQAHPAMPAYPMPDGSVKLAAGWLIEQSGWKGRRLGAVGMHARQALVLVNQGGASFDEVMALEQAVRADVLARFGVTLEREPLVVR